MNVYSDSFRFARRGGGGGCFCRNVVSLFTIIVLWLLSPSGNDACAQAQSELAPLSQTPVYSSSAQWLRQQQVSDGYLVSLSSDRLHITLTSLRLLNDHQIQLTLDGGAVSLVTGATVSARGTLAITGLYRSNTTGRVSSFLAYADFSGRVSKLVDLGAFAPEGACSSGDGTIWVLGQDLSKEAIFWSHGNDTGKTPQAADYFLLHAYNANAELAQLRFPRSSLHLSNKLFLNMASQGSGAALGCGPESVGVYVRQNDLPIWYELDRKDGSAQMWNVSGISHASKLTGLALPFSSTEYASFLSPDATFGIYRLILGNNAVAQWVKVSDRLGRFDPDFPALKVLGSESGQLIYVNGVTATGTHAPIVAWSPVARSSVLTFAITPVTAAPDGAIAASDGHDVTTMIWDAEQLLAKLPGVCSGEPCSSAMQSLQQTVAQWKLANSQSARSNSSDARTVQDIRKEVLAINDALAIQVEKSGAPLPYGMRGVGTAQDMMVPAFYRSCGQQCDSSGLVDLTLRNSANTQGLDDGSFLRVTCTTSCIEDATFAKDLCIFGGSVSALTGQFWGVLVAVACVAGTVYWKDNCETLCDQKVTDCSISSQNVPDEKKKRPGPQFRKAVAMVI